MDTRFRELAILAIVFRISETAGRAGTALDQQRDAFVALRDEVTVRRDE